MNFYVVVEGRVVEKTVYRVWIPEINPSLKYVPHPSDLIDNNFAIVSGDGYPNYFEIIKSALDDVKGNPHASRLIVCVDSEDETSLDKYNEIDGFIKSCSVAGVDYKIVIQHFCFETWALGNRRIGARNPKNPLLAEFKVLHDVVKFDPEDLPEISSRGMNRSQFAEVYLRLMLNDKNKRLTYSKSNPEIVAHPKFLKQLRVRRIETGHILSFKSFLEAFN